jgi:cytochrome c-type biogenesis protein CcmH/NrfG
MVTGAAEKAKNTSEIGVKTGWQQLTHLLLAKEAAEELGDGETHCGKRYRWSWRKSLVVVVVRSDAMCLVSAYLCNVFGPLRIHARSPGLPTTLQRGHLDKNIICLST